MRKKSFFKVSGAILTAALTFGTVYSAIQTNVSAADRKDEAVTGEFVSYDDATHTCKIVYSIDSDKEDEVTIDFLDIWNTISTTSVYGYIEPGDRINYDISVKNNTGSEYKYKTGSFTVSTPDFVIDEETNKNKTIYGFDEKLLPDEYVTSENYRQKNTSVAIANLFKEAGAVDDSGKVTTDNYKLLDKYLADNYEGSDFDERMFNYILKYYGDEGKYANFSDFLAGNKTAAQDFYSPSGAPLDLYLYFNQTDVYNYIKTSLGYNDKTNLYIAGALLNKYLEKAGISSTNDYTSYTTYTALTKEVNSELGSSVKNQFFYSQSYLNNSVIKLYDSIYLMNNDDADTAYGMFLKSVGLYEALPETYTKYNTTDVKVNNITKNAKLYFTEKVNNSVTYDKFYNTQLSLYFGDATPEELTNCASWCYKGYKYAVADYMNNTDNLLSNTDNYFAELFGDEFAGGDSVSFINTFNVDGANTGNFYMDTKWSWVSTVTLEKVVPEPTTEEETTTEKETEVEGDDDTIPEPTTEEETTTKKPEVEADEETTTAPVTEEETTTSGKKPEVEADVDSGDHNGLTLALGLAALFSGATTVYVFKKKRVENN